jgi:ribosomal protein S18 acetylase RimI-like enzyme
MKLDELDIPEASPIELLKRKLSPALHADQYEKAADTMYNVLQRKREENNGKFRHGLGYYAQQIGRSFNKVDYRALLKVFTTKYGEEFPELVNELKIQKPDEKDTMGIKRAEMPQVATKDYPEFIDYLKDNGAHFTKDTVSPDSLKAIQGEFSDQGIEKALMKQHIKKPSIVSSDNYIIDGHHRWLAAMNTGQKVDIFRVDKPGKELLQLVKDFPKTTYKDIYTEAKVKEGAEITMWTNPEYQGSDVDDEYYNKQPVKLIDVNKLTPFEPADKMDDEISAANMGKLVTAIQAGEKINPVVITKHQGKWLIIDGHHRYFAHLKAGVDKIRVVVADPKDLTWRDDVPIDEELTVKQSHIFKVVSNLADRKDNRPFPIKFYDGGTLEVQPSTAKRIIDFYYQANDALQTKLLKFLPTYNGFKEIAKAAGAVQESAGVGKITKQNSTPDVKPGETERQAKKFFPMNKNGKPKPLGVPGATPNQAFNLGLTEDVDGMPHLYLDMDGVQADFFTQWAKWHSEKTGQKVSSYRDIGDAEAQLASIIDMTNQGPEFVEKFFATLSPLNGFSPILNWIKKNNIPYSILSAPLRGNHKASIAGKKAWLSKHNPNAKEEIFTGTKEKYAMAGGQPNVLIDDHGKYITRWQSNGGIGIKHTDKNPQATISALEKIYSNQVEENISVTGTRRGQEARKKKLRPGSEAWFKHWFSLPLMKREDLELAKTEMLEYAKQYMQEGYRLQLERGTDMDVLHITDTTTGKRTEVRGKPDYERAYDPTDKLHQLLDKIGKASNISDLINGEVVGINPKHPDGSSAKKHADTAFNEANEIKTKKNPDGFTIDLIVDGEHVGQYTHAREDDIVRNQAEIFPEYRNKGYGTMLLLAAIKTADDLGLDFEEDTQSLTPAMSRIYDELDDSGMIYGGRGAWAISPSGESELEDFLNENFKDGKVKGKSRPGRVKRSGASCDGSVTDLRAKAKKSSGEKAKMYHWCANMKSGRK